jgi:hypothetical protein
VRYKVYEFLIRKNCEGRFFGRHKNWMKYNFRNFFLLFKDVVNSISTTIINRLILYPYCDVPKRIIKFVPKVHLVRVVMRNHDQYIEFNPYAWKGFRVMQTKSRYDFLFWQCTNQTIWAFIRLHINLVWNEMNKIFYVQTTCSTRHCTYRKSRVMLKSIISCFKLNYFTTAKNWMPSLKWALKPSSNLSESREMKSF